MASTDNIISTLKKYYHSGWEYVIPVGASANEVQAVSNYVESQGQNLVFIDTTDLSTLAPMAYNQRTAGFSLPQDDENGAVLGAATIGRIGGLTVGSFDLANLSGLKDVVPQDELNFQEDQEVPYKQANVNTYYYAQGTPILRDGKTLAGYYVDTFLGLDWIVKHSLKSLTEVMTKNNRLPFDAAGINVLQSALNVVFTTAFDNGIIDDDDAGKPRFTITALKRDELNSNDVKDRIYKGLAWNYYPANSIDDAVISGTINL